MCYFAAGAKTNQNQWNRAPQAGLGPENSSRPPERSNLSRPNGLSSSASTPTSTSSWNTKPSFEPARVSVTDTLVPRHIVNGMLFRFGLMALKQEVLEYVVGTHDRAVPELEQILERSAMRDIVEQLSQKEALELFDSGALTRRPERPPQPPAPHSRAQASDRCPWNEHNSQAKGLLHPPQPQQQPPAPTTDSQSNSKVSSNADPSAAHTTAFKRIPKLRPISQISADNKGPIIALQSSERSTGVDSASEDVSVSASRQHSEDELESSTARSSRRDRRRSTDEEQILGRRKPREQSSDQHSGTQYTLVDCTRTVQSTRALPLRVCFSHHSFLLIFLFQLTLVR